MSPQRWSRMREVFEGALVCQPEAIEEFLRAECGGDDELYSEVRRMLAAHSETGPIDHGPMHTASAPTIPLRGSAPVFSNGDVIAGRYRVIRYLSRGGMGEVYEAQHLELLGEHVAIKTLLPEIASDARMIARFKQEIQLCRKITHPNVCRVFDLERHPPDGPPADATYFFTMAFLDGETLSRRLERQGRMSTAEALPLVAQMAEALDAAHQAGVIHRDFKPSNVMLVPESGGTRAVVTDFGIARRAVSPDERTVTKSRELMGTLDYMAPELLTGAQSSVQSDVYALGMTAYKMVAGALPFHSTTPLGAAIMRARGEPPSPRKLAPDLDARWERALLKALATEPAKRFGSAQAFVEALRSEGSSITVTLPPVSRRQWVGAAAVGLLVVGVLVGWRALVGWRERPSAEVLSLYQTGVDDIHSGAYFAASKALSDAVQKAPGFALGRARLAETWLELEQPEKASQEMLLARRQETGGLSQRDRLQMEAVDLTLTRDFSAAVAKYEQLRSRGGADPAGLDVDLGRAYEKAAEPAKAMEAYRRAAEGPAHSPAAWVRLGVLYAQQSQAARSDEAFQNAERQYQNTSNLEGITQVEYQRGVAANRQMRLTDGAAHLEKALETARLAANLQQEIAARMQLGNNAVLAGDAEKAEQYSRGALEIAQANQMQSQAVMGMMGIGAAYFRRRDFQEAARYYQDALSLARNSGTPRLVARCTLSLASLHDQMGDSPAAEREAMEALAFYRANAIVRESLQCLALAGRAQRKHGEFTRALDSFRQLLDLATKANDWPQIVLAHESMGSLYLAEERYPEALAEYRKNLQPPNDPEHLAWAQAQAGFMLERLGNYDEGQSLIGQAAPAAVKYGALASALAADAAYAALSREKFGEAVSAGRRALTLNPGPELPLVKGTLGQALILSAKKGEGLKECEEAVAAAHAINDQHALVAAELSLLRARIELGDAAGARTLFAQLAPLLPNHPESRWRALALMSLADSAYKKDAAQAAEELRRAWGDDIFQMYRQRPDVARLLRALNGKEK